MNPQPRFVHWNTVKNLLQKAHVPIIAILLIRKLLEAFVFNLPGQLSGGKNSPHTQSPQEGGAGEPMLLDTDNVVETSLDHGNSGDRFA